MESPRKIKIIDREYGVPESLIDYINSLINQDEELKTMIVPNENGIAINTSNPKTLQKTLMRFADILAVCLVSAVSCYDDELSPNDGDFDPDYFLNIRRKINCYAELINYLISKKKEEKIIEALLDYIEYSIGTYIEIDNREQLQEEQPQI